MEDRLGRDDRLERRIVEPADPAQRFLDLLGLRRDLCLVGEILEAAAAAVRVVLARSLDARRARLHDLDGERLGVVALHLRHTRAHGVAGQPALDEDDEAVQARDAVAAVGERVDLELELFVDGDRRGHATSIGAAGYV